MLPESRSPFNIAPPILPTPIKPYLMIHLIRGSCLPHAPVILTITFISFTLLYIIYRKPCHFYISIRKLSENFNYFLRFTIAIYLTSIYNHIVVIPLITSLISNPNTPFEQSRLRPCRLLCFFYYHIQSLFDKNWLILLTFVVT